MTSGDTNFVWLQEIPGDLPDNDTSLDTQVERITKQMANTTIAPSSPSAKKDEFSTLH